MFTFSLAYWRLPWCWSQGFGGACGAVLRLSGNGGRIVAKPVIRLSSGRTARPAQPMRRRRACRQTVPRRNLGRRLVVLRERARMNRLAPCRPDPWRNRDPQMRGFMTRPTIPRNCLTFSSRPTFSSLLVRPIKRLHCSTTISGRARRPALWPTWSCCASTTRRGGHRNTRHCAPPSCACSTPTSPISSPTVKRPATWKATAALFPAFRPHGARPRAKKCLTK